MSHSRLQTNSHKYSLGFTLIEVLVYSAIVAVMALFLSGSIVTLLKGRGATVSQSEVSDAARLAEERIVQDIRSATSLATPATAGANASILVMTVAGNTITYDVNAGVLRRQVNAGTPAAVTPGAVTVVSADFVRLENTSVSLGKTIVSIQTTLVMASGAGNVDQSYSETRKFTATLP